ncbi:hypothetical protein EC957_010360 [Mortierella hygrophila]|uniref:Uncharacterized protein n=1 Tax=Mortierella hygrophila TaxID=979708 RepID=A0A9P6JXD4_9FUNG|nr:hypothetical protein EC957_010360 [Mortierella hygrophila]
MAKVPQTVGTSIRDMSRSLNVYNMLQDFADTQDTERTLLLRHELARELNNPVQHIYTPQDLDNAHAAKPATRPLLRDFEQTKANSEDRTITVLWQTKSAISFSHVILGQG